MLRSERKATPEEMDEVVKAYARLDHFATFTEGWYGMDERGRGPWGKRIGPRAIAGARKLIAGRPHLAALMCLFPTIEGGILIEERDAARTVNGGPVPDAFVCLEITQGGGCKIIWDPEQGDCPATLLAMPGMSLEGVSVGNRDMMKALDRLTRPRTGKILAHKPVVDGIRFDSELEARRYRDLKGDPLVRDLRWQVPFAFEEGGKILFRWISDFIYRRGDGPEIIEDVKGMKTPVYRLKKKLIEARHGITISEWPEPAKKKRKATARRKKG